MSAIYEYKNIFLKSGYQIRAGRLVNIMILLDKKHIGHRHLCRILTMLNGRVKHNKY